MNKTKIIKLILILLVVAAVAVGTVLIINEFGGEEPVVDPNVKLITKTDTDIIRMSFVAKDGEEFTLKWLNTLEGKQEASFPDSTGEVEQSNAKTSRAIFATLNANRLIEADAKDLVKYGLATPAMTVTATCADGSTLTVKIGNTTPAKNAYYVTVAGGDVSEANVYTILLVHANELLQTRDYFRHMPTLAVDEGSVILIEFKPRNGSALLMSALNESYGLANWVLISPFVHEISTDALDPFVGQILSTVPSKVIKENATDEELAQYGLRTEEEFVKLVGGENGEQRGMLEFGNALPDDSDMRYMAVDNGRTVYAIEAGALGWLKTPTITLLEKRIISTNIKYLEKMILTEADGNKLELTVERTEKKDENGETVKDSDGNIEYNEKFFLNGKAVDEKQTRRFYADYVGLMVSGDYDSEKGHDENSRVLTMEVFFSDSILKERKIDFYPYGNGKDYYAVIMDGVPAFYIRKGSVDSLLEENGQFADGTLKVG